MFSRGADVASEHLNFCAALISTRLQPGDSAREVNPSRFSGFQTGILALAMEAVETAEGPRPRNSPG